MIVTIPDGLISEGVLVPVLVLVLSNIIVYVDN